MTTPTPPRPHSPEAMAGAIGRTMETLPPHHRRCVKCGTPKRYPREFKYGGQLTRTCAGCLRVVVSEQVRRRRETWRSEGRDARGVDRTPRPCRVCNQTLAKPTAKGKPGVCVPCKRARQHRWGNATTQPVSDSTTGHGLFEATLAALEPLWGPMEVWSRAQHRQHTAWLARLTGVSVRETAPVYDPHEAVIIPDISVQPTKRAA